MSELLAAIEFVRANWQGLAILAAWGVIALLGCLYADGKL